MAEAFSLVGKIALEGGKELEKKLEGVEKKLKKTADGFKNAGKKLTKGLTAPLTAVGGLAVASADTIDNAFRDIRVATGATGDKMEELEGVFEDVFAQLPNSADEVAGAIGTLNTLTGATGEVLGDLTKNVLDASRTLGEDGSGASEAFGKALAQWQVPAEDGTKHLDFLYKMTQDYGVSLTGLSGNLTKFGPVLQNAGFDMAETAELFGSLEANGIQVTRVMPGLNMAFRNWASQGKDSRAEFEKVIEKMKEAETETEALGIASDVFGAQGAQRLTTAIRNGAIPSLDELGTGLGDSEGLIETTAEETKTMGERFAEIKNKATLGLEPLGEILINLAEQYLPPLIEKIEQLANWFKGLSDDQQKTIVIVGLLVAGLGPLLLIIGGLIGIITNVITVVKSLRTAMTLLNLATLPVSGTVLLVVGAILALIVVGYLVWKYWEQISAFFVELWNKMRDKAIEIFTKIKDAVTQKVQELKQKVQEKFQKIKDAIVNKFNEAKERLKSILGAIRDFFEDGWNKIKTKTSETFSKVKKAITDPIEKARDKIKEAIDKIKGFFEGLDDKLKIKIPKPKLPRFSLSGKLSLRPPSVPKLNIAWNAEGGILDTANLIGIGAGEAGEELIMPLTGRNMHGLAQTIASEMPQQDAGAGGIIEKINVPVYLNGREIARATANDLDRELEKVRKQRATFKGMRTT